MRLIAVLLVLVTLAGCKGMVRTEVVEVVRMVETKVDPVLTQPTTYVMPDMACWLCDASKACARRHCNGQLLTIIAGQGQALEQCNADKAAIRASQQ